ncbi:MAG TPA: CPBP family intramembrane glutamic endopeptidase [Solirubrobacteraceae bacterium]|jgi:membrane protease YdiL (CAAX protease family)|nr:CPBP family intramembrane glutamic endopeptidase [Solirubrobacteraceae bacterium]
MAALPPENSPAPLAAPPLAPPEPPDAPPPEPLEGDPSSSPLPGWPWWTALVALLGAFVLTAIGALVVDLPAVAFGVQVTSSHTPPGLTIADTFVQDLAFVAAPIMCAHIGGRAVRAWQFGLRRPGVGWGGALLMVLTLIIAFLVVTAIWSSLVNPEKEKLLEQLGSKESTLLLVLSAGLTCVVAPMCEEFLFRGYIFTALRGSWGLWPAAIVDGLLFGAVHASSAPVLDLLPLAGLGFGLCLLYRYSGSLYPGMGAHALNNAIAFASLESWSWLGGLALIAASLAGVTAVIWTCKRVGLIVPGRGLARAAA